MISPFNKAAAWSVLAFALTPLTATAGQMLGYSYASFDVPGSTDTNPEALSQTGWVGGYSVDAAGHGHGFVRDPGGNLSGFDATRGITKTVVQDINNNGQSVGYYYEDGSGDHAFIRNSNGIITSFDVTGSGSTRAYAIDNAGRVAGSYTGNTNGVFLRGNDGSLTESSTAGEVYSLYLNDSGQLAGMLLSGDGHYHGFVWSTQGVITTFDAFGAWNTEVLGINSTGQVAGSYFSLASERYFGFIRNSDGTMTSIDVPGSTETRVETIDDSGRVAGEFAINGHYHGFIMAPDGTLTTIDVPGSLDTTITAFNETGQVTGNAWMSFNPRQISGFVATPIAVPEPSGLVLLISGAIALPAYFKCIRWPSRNRVPSRSNDQEPGSSAS